MGKASKQLKKMRKMQEEYQLLIREEQARCPHMSRKGKSWLVEFTEGNVQKARCKKCEDVLVVDEDLLTSDALKMNVETLKTALSEIRAQAHLGNIKLSDSILDTMSKFDSEVLRDLPESMSKLKEEASSDKKKKKKGKKKGKKKDKKRRRLV